MGHVPDHVLLDYAMSERNNQLVLNEIDAGKDVNFISRDAPQHYTDYSLLMIAASYNNRSLVEALLDRGANINLQNGEGHTALMMAIMRRAQTATVSLLLRRGASPNIQDITGETALHKAALHSDNEMYGVEADNAAILIERGATITIPNNQGQTALHLAARSGDHEMLVHLLHPHMDVNQQDALGNTPLHYALLFPDLYARQRELQQVAEDLLVADARTNIANNQGDTTENAARIIVERLQGHNGPQVGLLERLIPAEETPLNLPEGHVLLNDDLITLEEFEDGEHVVLAFGNTPNQRLYKRDTLMPWIQNRIATNLPITVPHVGNRVLQPGDLASHVLHILPEVAVYTDPRAPEGEKKTRRRLRTRRSSRRRSVRRSHGRN